MQSWRSALIDPNKAILDAVSALDRNSLQILLVVGPGDRLLGTVTDGDIRRGIIRGVPMNASVTEIMNPRPSAAGPGDSRERMAAMMRVLKLKHLPIIDSEGTVIGLCTVDDLLVTRAPRDNWVVLMAGGQGVRLRPLTDSTPKPLLRVGTKPILETIIERFLTQDFRKFYISVNYKREMIREYFGDGSRWDAEIRYLDEDAPLGTAGPLGLLPEVPEHPFIVMNGDLLTDVSFGSMLDFHCDQKAVATMGVREYEFQVQFGVVETEAGQITAINEKPVHRFLINGGVYVLNPEVVTSLDGRTVLDMPHLFGSLIEAGKRTVVFPILESWLDIGRHEDLQHAHMLLSQ
jgi:dTDP-glucose pyrophosphorylase